MIETLSWLTRGCYSTATLLAAGSALLAFVSANKNPLLIRSLRNRSRYIACLSLCLSVLWVVVLAAEMGGDWASATDVFYYELIRSSAAGQLLLYRTTALLGLILWSYNTRLPPWAGAFFALLAVFSFSRYGHALTEPQWLRSLLLVTHLSIIAWWFAAIPALLHQLHQGTASAMQLADRFSSQASWGVALVIVSGFAFAASQFAAHHWEFQTPYGQALLIKLGVVSIIIAIGALNRHTYFPALKAGTAQAKSTLYKILILDAILFVTTILSSAWLTGPAANG